MIYIKTWSIKYYDTSLVDAHPLGRQLSGDEADTSAFGLAGDAGGG